MLATHFTMKHLNQLKLILFISLLSSYNLVHAMTCTELLTNKSEIELKIAQDTKGSEFMYAGYKFKVNSGSDANQTLLVDDGAESSIGFVYDIEITDSLNNTAGRLTGRFNFAEVNPDTSYISDIMISIPTPLHGQGVESAFINKFLTLFQKFETHTNKIRRVLLTGQTIDDQYNAERHDDSTNSIVESTDVGNLMKSLGFVLEDAYVDDADPTVPPSLDAYYTRN